jgi:hypothetical protein
VSRSVTDSLFKEIGIPSVKKHFFVVIAFNNQVVSFSGVIGYIIGYSPDVGCQCKLVITELKKITGIVAAVVRDIESGNPKIFYLKRLSLLYNSFSCTVDGVFNKGTVTNAPVYLLCSIDRYIKFFAQVPC